MADKSIDILDQCVRSIRIKHIDVLVKDLVKVMRQEGKAEPQFGFTSQDLREYFIKRIYSLQRHTRIATVTSSQMSCR